MKDNKYYILCGEKKDIILTQKTVIIFGGVLEAKCEENSPDLIFI